MHVQPKYSKKLTARPIERITVREKDLNSIKSSKRKTSYFRPPTRVGGGFTEYKALWCRSC
jgi:hypothetical protein